MARLSTGVTPRWRGRFYLPAKWKGLCAPITKFSKRIGHIGPSRYFANPTNAPNGLAGLARRCFRFEQLLNRAERGEVISQKLVVFNPDSQVAFQKRNKANEPERIDMKRFVRVANRRERRAGLVQIISQLLRYFHFL